MKLYLSKICNTGPAPSITVNGRIKSMVNLRTCKDDSKMAYYILTNLYINRKMSQQRIANLFDVQHDTVRRWLDRLSIPVRSQGDSVSIAMTKYPKNSFSEDLTEKAYLIGLRTGDLSTRMHGRNIRVSVSSTHPAMLKLFESVLSKYGKIGKYPHFDKNPSILRFHRYQWVVYCDTDKSFGFLINKHNTIPEWIKGDCRLFYSFLSGYFDAEGCIFLDYVRGNGSKLVWIIRSTDKHILSDIRDFLVKNGFNAKLRMVKEADGIEYSKDYWSVTVCTKSQVLKLLKNMKLKHSEKISKHKLALELVNSDWEDANRKILKLRKSIKNEVKDCVESAKKEYIKNH